MLSLCLLLCLLRTFLRQARILARCLELNVGEFKMLNAPSEFKMHNISYVMLTLVLALLLVKTVEKLLDCSIITTMQLCCTCTSNHHLLSYQLVEKATLLWILFHNLHHYCTSMLCLYSWEYSKIHITSSRPHGAMGLCHATNLCLNKNYLEPASD